MTIAQELKMTSIALPAIGSGMYGMPKDACAEVMFDAVEEFVRQGYPKKKTITDIRFVNIDDPSVQAFRQEFISRYGNSQGQTDSKKLAGRRAIKMPPTGADDANSPPMLPSRSDRGENKNKATNPSNHHFNTTSGSSVAENDHPSSGFNHSSSLNTSYSGAVKKNTSGNDARWPITQEPRGASNAGFSHPLEATVHRKDEGKK